MTWHRGGRLGTEHCEEYFLYHLRCSSLIKKWKMYKYKSVINAYMCNNHMYKQSIGGTSFDSGV
jgi:hypothetical protein